MYNVNNNDKELRENFSKESPYYGQWETDRVIETYFQSTSKGICIEVGAANGIKGSNTKYFEDKGWDVLCIEPNLKQKASLEKSRSLVKLYACGKENREGVLHVFGVGRENIYSSLTSLNPDKRLVEAHSEIINERSEVTVPVRTLNWILETQVKNTNFEKVTDIDFISIDTEGTELDVVKGLDTNLYNVKLFVIENNYEDKEVEEYMESIGYTKDQRYKINDFYIKRSDDGR